jgi:serine/threonine protein kinase
MFKNGTVKLCDFGFCKKLKKDEKTKTMCGSPLYMAPEILFGHAYNFKVDVWSLGVLLYEMIFGYCPYEG